MLWKSWAFPFLMSTPRFEGEGSFSIVHQESLPGHGDRFVYEEEYLSKDVMHCNDSCIDHDVELMFE